MAKTMTPSQTVAGFALMIAMIFIMTAIAWAWPDAANWVLGATVLLVAIFLFFAYRAERKEERRN